MRVNHTKGVLIETGEYFREQSVALFHGERMLAQLRREETDAATGAKPHP